MWCTKINQSIGSKQPRIWERDNIIRKNSHFFLAHWKYFLSWRGEEIKLAEDDNLFEVAAWPQKEKMWFLQKCKCSVFKAFCDVFLQTSVLENRKMAKQSQTLPLLGIFYLVILWLCFSSFLIFSAHRSRYVVFLWVNITQSFSGLTSWGSVQLPDEELLFSNEIRHFQSLWWL